MRVLALDTATEACTVALLAGEDLISETVEIGRGHAQEILSMVDRVLAQAGATLSSLSGIAASIGPGSFTGVRVCVSVAQGLAFGAGLPVVPVTTLEALALEAMGRGAVQVLACLDARMGEVYWGCFAARPAPIWVGALSPVSVGPAAGVRLPAAAGSTHFRGIGRGFAAYPELLRLADLSVEGEDARALPQAGYIARLGAARLETRQGLDPALLEPLYVRDKVALTEAERRGGQGEGK
ncbi:MAG TPA: tRNA (adenosine(37)-N6)-threonylcarbamoyltransferase complex dimerization subunit type 1 TsaB [Steroidobacteraceae bacterium]|jgi:tRNA threonylcarbamoyladenosine biosynthesis protein TsaB|nr:tRNA (adenosine(37)-N6)-threonylcarbamoyltransferase complex dimerization subunit type 1 TsaB [Steroidobacteraceae bacterium]